MHLAPKSPKVTVFGLRFNLNDCLAYFLAFTDPEKAKEIAEKDPYFDYKMMGVLIRETIMPDTKKVVKLAQKTQVTVVVSTFLGYTMSRIICDTMLIPCISLHLQPMYPTAYYPSIATHPEEAAAAIVHLQNGNLELVRDESNLIEHRRVLEATVEGIVDDINKERAEFGLEPMSLQDIFESVDDTHILIAMQSQLLPRVPDLPPRSHIVGSLAAAFITNDWTPDASQAALVRFLADGPPPVAVSYGSMDGQGVADQATRAILKGLRAADVQRVVLLPGKALLGLHHLSNEDPQDAELLTWAKDRVLVTQGNVQYAWLLPQCAMMFSHCGAGTTSAALRAGIPVLGTPLIGDQSFFVELLRLMKLGTRVGTKGLPVSLRMKSKGLCELETAKRS